MIKLTDIIDELIEEGRFIYVVRNRKRIRRLAPRPGYKIVGGRYIKMTGGERIKRKIDS